MAAADELAYYRALGFAGVDIDTMRAAYFKAVLNNTLAPGQYGAFHSGNYYSLCNVSAVSSSGSFTNGSIRLVPFIVPRAVTLALLSLEIVAAGTAGCTVRLGIYNDDGTGIPSTLLAEAGTIPADVIATPEVAFATPPTLQAGLYWGAAVIQGAPATLPGLRTSVNYTPPVLIGSTTAQSAGAIKSGYTAVADGSTGPLPASAGGVSAVSLLPRIVAKVQ